MHEYSFNCSVEQFLYKHLLFGEPIKNLNIILKLIILVYNVIFQFSFKIKSLHSHSIKTIKIIIVLQLLRLYNKFNLHACIFHLIFFTFLINKKSC